MALTISGFNMTGNLTAVHVPPPATPPTIGDSYGGGYYAGKISTTGDGTATHYLIVAPNASGSSINLKWQTAWTSTAGTSSVIDGPTNTSNMNDASHPAAQFCKGLTIGGYSDWYLPAKNELEVCYYNLKPTTGANDTSSGTNTNAVPSRGSNYTSGSPAQTSATDFRSTGGEAYSTGNAYWSSTEYNYKYARTQIFSNGTQYYNGYFSNKQSAARFVRAVRRVAI